MGRGGTGPDSVFMIILLFVLGCSPFAALQQPCGEGEGLTAGCRDWVRGEKALPFLRADFQDNLSPREREEDKKSGGTEVNSLFPGWTFSSAHQIS